MTKCPVCAGKERNLQFPNLCTNCGWELSNILGVLPDDVQDSIQKQITLRKKLINKIKQLEFSLKERRIELQKAEKIIQHLEEKLALEQNEYKSLKQRYETLSQHEALTINLDKLNEELRELENKDTREDDFWSKEALVIEYYITDKGLHVLLPQSMQFIPKMVLGISRLRSIRRITEAEFLIHLNYKKASREETYAGSEMIVPLPIQIPSDVHHRLALLSIKRRNHRLYQIICTNK